MMSSMRKLSIFVPLLLASATSASGQTVALPAGPSAANLPAASNSTNWAIADWRRLTSPETFAFADYARFVSANPGWPGESGLRAKAEKLLRAGENPQTVIRFFAEEKPQSGNGWARLVEAYTAAGRTADALDALRRAWLSADLSSYDEQQLFARYATQLTSRDHDGRIDALLFGKKPADAQRMMAWSSPARRPALAARIALQQRLPDAEAQYRAVAAQAASDAGLLMDRLRYLRDANDHAGARWLAARPHQFSERPADPARWYDMMVILAKDAYDDRQYQSAFDIARQVDDAFAPGTEISGESYAVRDNYTTLTWIAAISAYERLNRPADAMVLFDKYARGGKSLQVATKGWYWAGRAAIAARNPAEASSHFEKAAATPELFYGQLALERLGRIVPAPAGTPSLLVTDAQRKAFYEKPLVRAVRALGQQGRYSEQSQFVRALSESLDNDADRLLATELATYVYRPDLSVWTARSARNNGSAFYYRAAFPTHSGSVTPGRVWSLVHGITRQESSFDKAVVSHAGARGMMQLMPPTAREQAAKLGVEFEYGRLTSDPAYNVMLGSAYFQRLLAIYDGSYPLAVAAYNAGPGNVRKWINAYGDPRGNIDIVSWIEKIPFTETRGYVQRVLENTVVYDRLNPTLPGPEPIHISAYLGKSGRPG